MQRDVGVRAREARAIVDAIFSEIMESVVRGEIVELRGIGTFRRKASASRWGRDFTSRQAMRVPAGVRVSYRISRQLRARLKAVAVDAS